MPKNSSLGALKKKAIALIGKLDVVRKNASAADLVLKKYKIEKGNIELELFEVLSVLKDNNIPMIMMDGIGTVSTRTRVYGDIAKTNIVAARKLFEKNGLEEAMFESRLVKRRLNEWVREQLAAAKSVPECISVVYKTGITIRNKKEA